MVSCESSPTFEPGDCHKLLNMLAGRQADGVVEVEYSGVPSRRGLAVTVPSVGRCSALLKLFATVPIREYQASEIDSVMPKLSLPFEIPCKYGIS